MTSQLFFHFQDPPLAKSWFHSWFKSSCFIAAKDKTLQVWPFFLSLFILSFFNLFSYLSNIPSHYLFRSASICDSSH